MDYVGNPCTPEGAGKLEAILFFAILELKMQDEDNGLKNFVKTNNRIFGDKE